MTSFEMQEELITHDKDGSVKLLLGYMFDPTDEVLVNFYLKRRVFSQSLPVQIIPDSNVFQIEPWRLPGGDGKIFNERKCFFYKTMGSNFESLGTRVAGNGQWKIVEKGIDVPIPRNNEVIGKRNTLIFWEVQETCVRRTKWVMHEFLLVLIANPSKMANWAVYRIFKKKDEEKMNNIRETNEESPNDGINARSVEVIDFNEEKGSF
ncbi:NAC domain-containing protein 83-like [Lotus japonicus]|uniref:NAC domain-containing protein 83-like n=1 Tax=Lotus japonicus TaxID=34305 RepID=UPI002590F9BE|nr:NAC domain-containing protein 83-like [Lotus japonicus]